MKKKKKQTNVSLIFRNLATIWITDDYDLYNKRLSLNLCNYSLCNRF